MKTIQTKSCEVLLVNVSFIKVPNVWEFKISGTNYLCYKINNKWQAIPPRLDSDKQNKIIGKFSELEDKDFEEFVEKHPNLYYRDYTASSLSKIINGWTVNWIIRTAKESFQSLCKSQGIEDDLVDYLIIKKL